ncbi:MAG: Hsp70 family protein [Cetobacterium sp.]
MTERSVGIDLGTTNTVVSYIDKKGEIKTIKFGRNSAIPSAIYFKTKDEHIFGESAIERGIAYPRALSRNFKSKMGSKERIEIIAENGDKLNLMAKDFAKLLLNTIFNKATEKMAKEFPGDFINKAIITVPAKFSTSEKEATKWAAKKAGIEEVKLTSESTAAAIAYASENELNKKVLVYDFGGGTFDVSIIEKKGEVYVDAVTPGGDKHLGGNILTKEIMDFFFEKIDDELGIEMPKDEDDFDKDEFDMSEDVYRKNYLSIYQEANYLKEILSDREKHKSILDIYKNESEIKTLEIEFDRRRLLKLIESHLDRTIKILDETIHQGLTKDDIGTIVLAGGSSLIPKVKEKIEKYFGKSVNLTEDTATLISKGAAILTTMIDGTMVGESILTNDIGIETNNGGMSLGVFDTLIEAGTLYSKAKGSGVFRLVEDNQETIKIKLFERDIKNYPNAKHTRSQGCEFLEEIVIKLPDDLKKDETKIILELEITSEGILNLDIKLEDEQGNLISSNELSYDKGSVLE